MSARDPLPPWFRELNRGLFSFRGVDSRSLTRDYCENGSLNDHVFVVRRNFAASDSSGKENFFKELHAIFAMSATELPWDCFFCK